MPAHCRGAAVRPAAAAEEDRAHQEDSGVSRGHVPVCPVFPVWWLVRYCSSASSSVSIQCKKLLSPRSPGDLVSLWLRHLPCRSSSTATDVATSRRAVIITLARAAFAAPECRAEMLSQRSTKLSRKSDGRFDTMSVATAQK